MESKNIKISTIQFIEKEGTWSNGDHTYQKYKLHLNNGEKPQFLAKSEKTIDDFNIGDEVKYSYKKAGQPFAKIEKEFNQPKIKQMPNTNTNDAQTATMTQQQSIARSVAWNNVSQFIFSEEFQKYNDPEATDKNGNKIILSDRQIRMLDQAIIAADLIYKQLLTKPK
jgi:hypothetical protein